MNNIWMLDIDTVLKIYELAQQHGKQAGESIEEEFLQIMKQQPEKFKHLGKTEQDASLFTGNLREEGLKVLNLNEEIEREKNKS